MTDISKCTGEGCPIKENCLRYTGPASEYQSYIQPPIKIEKDKDRPELTIITCVGFLKNE